MQPVAFCMNMIKGRARHIPPQTDPSVGLLRNMSYSSYIYIIYVVKKRHKAATRNCVPQWEVRCGACCGLLCLSNLDNKGCHKVTTCNCVPQGSVLNVFLIIYKRDVIIM